MTALPPMFEAGLAALLVACIIRAFFGPPPRVSDGLAAAGWMVAGVSLIFTVLIAGHDADPRDLLTAGGVMAICVAGWWLRRLDDEGPSQPELDGEGADPNPDSGIDWDEFDRLRAGWRPQTPA